MLGIFQSPGAVIIDFGEIFNLGISLPLRWYGLLTGLGFLAALLVIQRYLRSKITPEQENLVFDWALYSFLGGLLGARLWFVALNGAYFGEHPAEILAIWNGGQSIQGGFVGGILIAYLYFLIHKANLPRPGHYADAVGLGLPVAQAIGRWGNFFNNEAYGLPTDLPWGLYIPPEYRVREFLEERFFHPTFAYEFLYLMTVFGFLSLLVRFIHEGKVKLAPGGIFCLYLMLYSFGRFWFEFLRLDSLMLWGFPAAQVICFLTLIGAGFFLWLLNFSTIMQGKTDI
ncbi:MAG: prolipoprotein diacylglyceryl transferase [Candidatus Caenarcaniphilales bacterium]|nr:prolipoprotein diacylglyceryl transferase [Candidatus Caenarcaniphilales bacterium]